MFQFFTVPATAIWSIPYGRPCIFGSVDQQRDLAARYVRVILYIAVYNGRHISGGIICHVRHVAISGAVVAEPEAAHVNNPEAVALARRCDSLHRLHGGGIQPGFSPDKPSHPACEVCRGGDDITLCDLCGHVAFRHIRKDALIILISGVERRRNHLIRREHGHRGGVKAVWCDQVLHDELVVGQSGDPLDDGGEDRIPRVGVMIYLPRYTVRQVTSGVDAYEFTG